MKRLVLKKTKSQNISHLIEKTQNILEYIDYSYPNKNICKYEYKNSVSSVLHLEDNEETVFVGSDEKRENAIIRGNAYHEALKILDFDLINEKNDLLTQRELLQKNMTEGYFDYINNEILWENINIIKNVIKGQKSIKEKQFIMESSLKEAGITNSEQKVIIQGVVDLLSLGEKNILIDYKFTSEKDKNKLIKRYKKQLELYCLAVEKAFNKKIDEKYLLSLKHGELIKIEE